MQDNQIVWRHAGKRRWYAASVHVDLFGALTLVTQWGALDSSRGGLRIELCEGLGDARRRLAALLKRRRARKYALISALPALVCS